MSWIIFPLVWLVAGYVSRAAYDAIRSTLRRRKVRRDWTTID